jgi:lysophospholipase L1-like esterase
LSLVRKSVRRKLGAIAVGVVLAIGFAGCGLRLAGSVVYDSSGRAFIPEHSEGIRILCDGDSNVFGVFEPVDESYPTQLNSLLEKRSEGEQFSVINLGIPGFSLRQLLALIPKDLELIQPDIVLLTIGANDAWQWRPEANAEYAPPPLWEQFRLVKAIRLYFYRRGEGRIEESELHNDHISIEGLADEEQAWSTVNRVGEEVRRFQGTKIERQDDDTEYWQNLYSDFARLHELVGKRLVLVCYGSDSAVYGKANRGLRKVANELQIPLLDVTPELANLVEATSFSNVFWTDLHPRGLGYEVIARAAYNQLVELDLVNGEVIDDLLANLGTHFRETAQIQLVGSLADPDELQIQISGGQPGRAFSVVFWDPHRETNASAERPFFDIIKSDVLFRKSNALNC